MNLIETHNFSWLELKNKLLKLFAKAQQLPLQLLIMIQYFFTKKLISLDEV